MVLRCGIQFIRFNADKVERIRCKFTRLLYFKIEIVKVSYEAEIVRQKTMCNEIRLYKIVSGHVQTNSFHNVDFHLHQDVLLTTNLK